MLISTRGRYALRVLSDLAEYAENGYVPMKDVAARQSLLLKKHGFQVILNLVYSKSPFSIALTAAKTSLCSRKMQ